MTAPMCGSAGQSTGRRRPLLRYPSAPTRSPAGRRLLVGLFAAFAAPFPIFALQRSTPQRGPADTRDISRGIQSQIVRVVRQAGPCVVSISVPGHGLGESGLSGVVIDRQGHIATIAESLRAGRSVNISTAEGRQMPASILGVDRRFHLAVLKVEPSDLPPVVMGDGRSMAAGTWVVAIGNPLGGGNTVTVGTLSARDRDIWQPGEQELEYLLQTDAAINAENNGGAVVDLHGRLAGIAIDVGRAREAQGIGFAIPSELVRRVCSDLISHGRFRGAWYGILYRDLAAAELARARTRGGMMVERVHRGTPARSSGILAGDVITRFDGQPLRGRGDFRWRMIMAHPGERIKLEGVRRGRRITLTATLGTMPEVMPKWDKR